MNRRQFLHAASASVVAAACAPLVAQGAIVVPDLKIVSPEYQLSLVEFGALQIMQPGVYYAQMHVGFVAAGFCRIVHNDVPVVPDPWMDVWCPYPDVLRRAAIVASPGDFVHFQASQPADVSFRLQRIVEV